MIDCIEIFFDQVTSVTAKVDYQIVGHCNQLHSTIFVPAGTGLRCLTLQLDGPGRAEIKDVKVNGSSIRHLIYLSWTQKNLSRVQPCTAIWETDQVWCLPFGTPISWWIDCVLSQIPQHCLGQDLSQDWDIWYPDKLELPDTFPTLVRDFFNKDFGFTARHKHTDHRLGLPMQQLLIDSAELKPLASKSMQLWQQGDFDHVILKQFDQDQYNQRDHTAWVAEQWQICKLLVWNHAAGCAVPTVPTELFPEFFSWITKFSHVHHAQINFLQPGSYIAPHRDFGKRNIEDPTIPAGCSQCYIPLQWVTGSYLKLAAAGIIGQDSRAWVINNDEFTHSVVNNSQHTRSVLIVRADMQYNKHLLKETT